MRKKLLQLVAIFSIGLSIESNAQCTAPTGADVTTQPAICFGQGSVNVTNVTGVAPDSTAGLQYALFDDDGVTIVKPYQSSPNFTEVSYGTYYVKIRHQCNPSNVFTSTLRNVNGTNPSNPITLNSSTIGTVPASSCNNGIIYTTAATGGAGNYRYALVPTLNEPEPIAPSSYIHPPIYANGSDYSYATYNYSNAYFDSLAPGTYFLRAYDTCGSFATRQITVSSVASTDPYSDGYKNFVGCDSINMGFQVSSYTTRYPGYYYFDKYINNSNKFYLQYGSNIDTFNITSSGFSSSVYALSELRNGVDDTLRYTLSYINDCGVTNSKSYKYFIQDTLTYTYSRYSDSCKNRYVFSTYYNSALYNATSGSFINAQAIYTNYSLPAYYSIDSGLTWSDNYSILMELGDTVNFAIATPCGDTTRSIFYSAPSNFNITMYNQVSLSCPDKGGISVTINGTSSDANLLDSIRVLSQPGTSLDTLYVSPNITLPFRNLDPGMYKFRFYDKCGNMDEDSIYVTPLLLNVTIDTMPSPEGCGVVNYDKMLKVVIEGNFYDWYINVKNVSGTYDIYNNVYSTSTADSFITGGSPYFYRLVKYFALPAAGTYVTNVYSYYNNTPEGRECGEKDTLSVSTASQVATLTLGKSIFTTSCADNTATIVAKASSGGGGYQYALWRISPDPDSLIYPASPNNVFNNLDPATVYEVRVTDQCGNGTQFSTSFTNAPIPVTPNRPDQPCNGDSITVSLPVYPNTNYIFLVNGVEQQNGPDNSYTFITTVGATSSDTITSNVAFGSCLVDINAKIVINPDECGEPLPIELLNFNGKIVNNRSVLNWTIADNKEEGKFIVTYSNDGISFKNIGEVIALSNKTNYAFTDEVNTNAGTRYYRLKYINNDGTFKYSNIVKLTTDNYRDASTYSIYPNMVENAINVVSSSASLAGTEWSIINVTGQVLAKGKFSKDELTGTIEIGNIIPSGNYFLRLNANANTYSFKFIKK